MDHRFLRPMERGLPPLDLTPNSDIVITGPYGQAITTTGNVSTARDYLNYWNKSRIRQTGNVTRVKFRTDTATTGEIEVKFWRYNGSTFDLVGTTGDISGSCAAATTNDITLGTPIAVQEGDYVGIRGVSPGANVFSARTGLTGAALRYFTGTASDPADFLGTGSTSANIQIPIEVYMQAPAIVHIGDSRVAGHPTHYAFTEATLATSLADTVAYKLRGINADATYQNMGIGSQTSANVASRIAADCTALKPKACVIEVGVNDVAGSVAEATYIANMTTILDALVAASVVPIVSLINPWKNGTSGQDATVNSFNAALITLLAGYPTARKVDCRLALSNGGDLGDVDAAYDADGVHFSPAGNAVIAQAIEDQAINPA